jgi:nicotinamidase-related amidase
MMKKFILRFLFWIGVSLLFFIAYVVFILNEANSVSKGFRIHAEDRTETVLFVIDVQEGITGEGSVFPAHQEQSTWLIENINELIVLADSLKIPIVYIQQQTENWFLNWATDYVFATGSPGVAVDGRVKIMSGNFFTKRKSDAFSNLKLDPFLAAINARRIVITGLDIAGCAGKTAQAALNRGYEVVVVEDAVISETQEEQQESLSELKNNGAEIVQKDVLPVMLEASNLNSQ